MVDQLNNPYNLQMDWLTARGGYIPNLDTINTFYQQHYTLGQLGNALDQQRAQNQVAAAQLRNQTTAMHTRALQEQAQHNPFFGPNVARQAFRF